METIGECTVTAMSDGPFIDRADPVARISIQFLKELDPRWASIVG